MKFFEYMFWEPKADPEVKDLEDECPCSFLGPLGNIFFVTSMECFSILFPFGLQNFMEKHNLNHLNGPFRLRSLATPFFFWFLVVFRVGVTFFLRAGKPVVIDFYANF